MSRVTLRFNGGPDFKAALMKGTDVGLARAASVYVSSLKKNMQITGPLPKVAKGVAGQNIPSNPGEFPAVQMGRLRMSLNASRKSWQRQRVGTNVPYASWLEFGTTRMQPRPFMIPTMGNLKLRADAQKVLAAEVRKSVKAVLV